MNIRTKIICSYIVFVLLIFSFLGLNYLIQRSAMKQAASIYDLSEDARLQMEAENAFWRQAISLTDFFIEGDEEHYQEFHNLQKIFSSHMDVVESTTDTDQEKARLREVRKHYDSFVATFDKAAAIYRTGHKDEARNMEAEEVD